MSGGSFNYFYSVVDEMLLRITNNVQDVSMVLDKLARKEHWQQHDGKHFSVKEGKDVELTADDIRCLDEAAQELATLVAQQRVIKERLEKYNAVLKAVEWLESGDWSPSSVIDAVKGVERG